MFHIAWFQQTSTCKMPTKGVAITLLQDQGQQRSQTIPGREAITPVGR